MTSSDPKKWVRAMGEESMLLHHKLVTLERRLAEHTEVVNKLAAELAALARHLGPGNPHVPRSWLLGDDPDLAVGDIEDLARWLGLVYLRYPGTRLQSCWAWHPDVVEEFLALRGAHREAYEPRKGSWTRAAEWHDRLLPGVVCRVEASLGLCSLTEHLPAGQHHAGPDVPLADHTAAIARHYAQMHQPPTPTEQQLADAQNQQHL